MQSEMNNIAAYLAFYACRHPEKVAYVLTGDQDKPARELTYAALDETVKLLAQYLDNQNLYGKRALLIYQDVQPFIISFLACQYAGIVPVPVPYAQGSKQTARLAGIAADAGVSVILCCKQSIEQIRKSFSGLPQTGGVHTIATDIVPATTAAMLVPRYHDTAFIQYTSGSTGNPKGVVVSNSNLLHNQLLIAQNFGCNQDSIILSWLPFHHDMGLIGNILHAIYTGCTCVLMSPSQFIQSPQRWLEAISTYRATHSGGPNFAYDLCVSKVLQSVLQRLDLSCWQVAYNGSEPIRQRTIQQFGAYFKPSGFSASAIITCYGLAEATLLVSSGTNQKPPPVIYIDSDASADGKIVLTDMASDSARAIVGSGKVAAGMDVKIVKPGSKKICEALEEGEILVAGESVTKGYWNKDNTEVFSNIDGRLYLHTGDLGFFKDGELFIHGRMKEMLIIRGKNFYPSDIEQVVAASDHSIGENGVAVFSIKNEEGGFVVAAEIKRENLRNIEATAIVQNINKSVTDYFGIKPYDILLVTPFSIPRTTSGKIQRTKCGETYASKGFSIIGSQMQLYETDKKRERNMHLQHEVIQLPGYENIKAYLIDIIECKTGGFQVLHNNAQIILTEMGLDSLGAMEVINTVNKDLRINIDAADVFRENTLAGLIVTIENMLWLKSGASSKEEITI
jgi:acyl-CoA synthetase (AMP-forming)/AMP-acid ligase II/acyl carrier protein